MGGQIQRQQLLLVHFGFLIGFVFLVLRFVRIDFARVSRGNLLAQLEVVLEQAQLAAAQRLDAGVILVGLVVDLVRVLGRAFVFRHRAHVVHVPMRRQSLVDQPLGRLLRHAF